MMVILEPEGPEGAAGVDVDVDDGGEVVGGVSELRRER